MGEIRNVNNNFIGKAERKRPFGKPRRIWEDNIRIELKEMG
jgi:hypothetical protein